MAIVKIPTPLRRLTGEKDEVLTSSNSVSGIRKFINIYINEEDIRFLDGPKTQINEKDTVSIIPAIAGGTSVN